MAPSNNRSVGLLNSARLGFAVLLAIALFIFGGILLLEGSYALGGSALGIGAVMLIITHHSYHVFKRRDDSRDERTRRLHEQAGFNAFWAVVFTTTLYGFIPVLPITLTGQIGFASSSSTEIIWALSLCVGLLVYLCTWLFGFVKDL